MSAPTEPDQQTASQQIDAEITALGAGAQRAKCAIAQAGTQTKNDALSAIADAVERARDQIIAQNQRDLTAAKERQLPAPMIDRLALDEPRIASMIHSLHQIKNLPDPVGNISELNRQPSGLQIGRMRVPIGVVGIIYESRPNVTLDAAALCIKSGNASLLRGGSEASHSNHALAACIQAGLRAVGLPSDIVQLVANTSRDSVRALLRLNQYIDVLIPRGGPSLSSYVQTEARMPVINHLAGICHVYIDADADADKARAIAINSKTYRYGICGAMETLLVHSAIAQAQLPPIAQQLRELGVTLRGCAHSCRIDPEMVPAVESDWQTEYLGPILSVRVVESLEQAIEHIAHYGSGHTDAIVTDNLHSAQQFMRQVDSSSVMLNAATCFADGHEYGLGAEIGISTNRLHVRGPVGLEGLTTQKYIVIGEGSIRA